MDSKNACKDSACKKRLSVLIFIGCLLIAGLLSYKFVRKTAPTEQLKGHRTVDTVVEMYAEDAYKRLTPKFKKAQVTYPPKQLLMLGLKSEKSLEIYAGETPDGPLKYVCTYPIIGNSGVLGPKLKEGDKQMPEGFYNIQELEPNSSYHVALRVNYPNEFDKKKGEEEGRTALGGDIMIHGYNKSIGCLAMGDPAAEELFLLVHDVGLDHTQLLMSPYDFRKPPEGVALPDKPEWIGGIYEELKKQIKTLPNSSSAS